MFKAPRPFKIKISKARLYYMYHIQDMTYKEIAKELGVSVDTIRSRILLYNIPIILRNKRSGIKSKRWKNGRYQDEVGYIHIYKPGHPDSKDGYILEHRLVMEGMIGRRLKPEEVVHHKNGIKNDNRPENLRLFEDTGSHIRFHHQEELPIDFQMYR